jgi:hypothetical protein
VGRRLLDRHAAPIVAPHSSLLAGWRTATSEAETSRTNRIRVRKRNGAGGVRRALCSALGCSEDDRVGHVAEQHNTAPHPLRSQASAFVHPPRRLLCCAFSGGAAAARPASQAEAPTDPPGHRPWTAWSDRRRQRRRRPRPRRAPLGQAEQPPQLQQASGTARGRRGVRVHGRVMAGSAAVRGPVPLRAWRWQVGRPAARAPPSPSPSPSLPRRRADLGASSRPMAGPRHAGTRAQRHCLCLCLCQCHRRRFPLRRVRVADGQHTATRRKRRSHCRDCAHCHCHHGGRRVRRGLGSTRGACACTCLHFARLPSSAGSRCVCLCVCICACV